MASYFTFIICGEPACANTNVFKLHLKFSFICSKSTSVYYQKRRPKVFWATSAGTEFAL